MEIKFLKYRHKFAHGYGSWEYEVIHKKNIPYVEELIEEKAREYDYSDKYRGIDYEVVDYPTDEYILSQINNAENNIRYYTELLEEMKRFKGVRDTVACFEEDVKYGYPI